MEAVHHNQCQLLSPLNAFDDQAFARNDESLIVFMVNHPLFANYVRFVSKEKMLLVIPDKWVHSTQLAFKPVLLDLLRQAQISQNTFMQELLLAERAALGTPALWATKDLSHMTFWRQRHVLTLQALLRKAPHPTFENFEELNPIIFEVQSHRSWSDISAASDHVSTALKVHVQAS